ncbi:hypothetical protein [Thermomonas sp.]|uniref:hypothetical protein n=1 Tax=Thermomonas sp. TaxID=1971895 RepID=UPI00248A003B|nr:hypothetical protein [Thermomonas sp.]MDI1252340.1 hypothetical protein [Thermomonas sp.]
MATRSNPARSHTVRLLLPVLAIGLLLPLTACQKAAEKAAEAAMERATGNKVDLDKDGGTMTIKSDEGEIKVATSQNGQSVPLPEDFPKDVFLPEHSAVNSAMDMAGMKMVNMVSDASSNDVSTTIQKSMEAQGWKREMAMQAAEGSATLVYSKDKRQTVYQMMKGDNGGTQIAIRTGGEG